MLMKRKGVIENKGKRKEETTDLDELLKRQGLVTKCHLYLDSPS
jgi:hypothetical protein